MTADWNTVWTEVDRSYRDAKDSQGAISELFDRYAELDPRERTEANKVLFEALRGRDEGRRYDALAIIREFVLYEAMPFLMELAIRLQFDDSPGAPFELAKVQRIIDAWDGPR
jgi:hypothetical protein